MLGCISGFGDKSMDVFWLLVEMLEDINFVESGVIVWLYYIHGYTDTTLPSYGDCIKPPNTPAMGIAWSLRTTPDEFIQLKHCKRGLCRFNQLRVSIFHHVWPPAGSLHPRMMGFSLEILWWHLWNAWSWQMCGMCGCRQAPVSWENTPVGLMKKIGYHLVSPKMNVFLHPFIFQWFHSRFFF